MNDRFQAVNPPWQSSALGRYGELSITTPMHRLQLCADRVSGGTVSSMTMVHNKDWQLIRIVMRAMSIRVAPRQRLVIPTSARRPRSWFAASQLEILGKPNKRWRCRGPNTVVGAIGSTTTADGARQLIAEIAHRVERPPVCEYYVEVRLPAIGPEPRNFSITTLERSTSAHSCNLCIGVASRQPKPAGQGNANRYTVCVAPITK
jgi:hypothetical protein